MARVQLAVTLFIFTGSAMKKTRGLVIWSIPETTSTMGIPARINLPSASGVPRGVPGGEKRRLSLAKSLIFVSVNQSIVSIVT